MKLPAPSLALVSLGALLLSSCVTSSTVESRIAARPEAYLAVPATHRSLIDQGRIKEGMSKDAVYLSWGAPDAVRESSDNGKRSETWLYESYEPVYTQTVGVGYGGYGYGGYGYGRRHRGYYDDCYPYGGGYSFGTEVNYVPHLSRTVEFRGDSVTAWQRQR